MSEWSIRGGTSCEAYRPMVKIKKFTRCEYQIQVTPNQMNLKIADKASGLEILAYQVSPQTKQEMQQELLSTVDNILFETEGKRTQRKLIAAHNLLKEWCPNCLPKPE